MVKKIVLLVLMTTGVLCLRAQDRDETPIVSPVIKKTAMPDKIDFNLSAGTSFMYTKNYGSGMSSYLAPEMTYKLTPKVHLNVGIMFLSSNIPYNSYQFLSDEKSVVIKSKPTTGTLAFVSGDYLINDRLTISGTLIKDLSNPQSFGRNNYNQSIQGMSLHMDYKLTNNITIGACMHMSQGNNNWGYPSTGYGLYPSNQLYPLLDY